MTACTFTEISPPVRNRLSNGLIDTLIRAGRQVSAPSNWIGGVQFVPEPCGGGGIFPPNCLATDDCDVKVANGIPEAVKWAPFNVYAAVQCGSFSDENEIQRRGVATFENSYSAIAAAELYYGVANARAVAGVTCDDGNPAPVNPYLATSEQLFPSGTVVDDWTTAAILSVPHAMALIENTLAEYSISGEGTIHVSPGLLTALIAEEFVMSDGGLFRTHTGHLVIGAPGYYGGTPRDPADPLDVSPGRVYLPSDAVEWVYVTGPMGLLLDEREVSSTFGHRRNNYLTLAEQYVLPYFDPTCARFAVPVAFDEYALPSTNLSVDGVDIFRIFNDHLVYCLNDDSGTEGEAMSPDVFLGVYSTVAG